MVHFIDSHRDRFGLEPICAVLPTAPSGEVPYANSPWWKSLTHVGSAPARSSVV